MYSKDRLKESYSYTLPGNSCIGWDRWGVGIFHPADGIIFPSWRTYKSKYHGIILTFLKCAGMTN